VFRPPASDDRVQRGHGCCLERICLYVSFVPRVSIIMEFYAGRTHCRSVAAEMNVSERTRRTSNAGRTDDYNTSRMKKDSPALWQSFRRYGNKYSPDVANGFLKFKDEPPKPAKMEPTPSTPHPRQRRLPAIRRSHYSSQEEFPDLLLRAVYTRKSPRFKTRHNGSFTAAPSDYKSVLACAYKLALDKVLAENVPR